MKNWRNSDYDSVKLAQWEQEQQRPYDWQDKVVLVACYSAIAYMLMILLSGCAAYDAVEKTVAVCRMVCP